MRGSILPWVAQIMCRVVPSKKSASHRVKGNSLIYPEIFTSLLDAQYDETNPPPPISADGASEAFLLSCGKGRTRREIFRSIIK